MSPRLATARTRNRACGGRSRGTPAALRVCRNPSRERPAAPYNARMRPTRPFVDALRSPMLPFWLVIALLPFGRSSELGTLLCLVGTVVLVARHPRALQGHADARLLLALLACYV